jgi:hypothetical protein
MTADPAVRVWAYWSSVALRLAFPAVIILCVWSMQPSISASASAVTFA